MILKAMDREGDGMSGKVVIVTGAASGIGCAQVGLFLEEGYKVFAVDRNAQGLHGMAGKHGAGPEDLCTFVQDLVAPGAGQDVAEACLTRFGCIDVLSNTAGILDGYAKSLDTSEALWDRVFAVNVKSMFMLCNAVLPNMLARGKGVIINVSSVASMIAGGGGAAYTASKHAVVGYTRQLSSDYGSRGIRVNALCPGMVETEMTAEFLADQDSRFVRAVRRVPAGRYAQPLDIAKVAVFLAGDGADFMHGAAVVVDGGLTIR